MQIYTLVNEDVVPLNLEEVKKIRKVVWVRSINPTSEEIEVLSQLSNAPVEEFKEFMEEDERPRLDIDKCLQVIYRSPYKEEGETVTVPITIFVNNNVLISVEKKKIDVFEKIEHLVLQKKARFLFKSNAGNLLYYMLDKINDDFLTHVDKISDRIDIYEQKQALMSRENVEKIYGISVTLSYFNQAMVANMEALKALRKTYYRHFNPKNKERFSELYYDALQILDTEKVQREVIANLFHLQSIISSDRLNRFMKRLTSLALIIMVPTLISGIYGMNFDYMPLLKWNFGFHVIIVLMIVITVVALFYFKDLDWL